MCTKGGGKESVILFNDSRSFVIFFTLIIGTDEFTTSLEQLRTFYFIIVIDGLFFFSKIAKDLAIKLDYFFVCGLRDRDGKVERFLIESPQLEIITSLRYLRNGTIICWFFNG